MRQSTHAHTGQHSPSSRFPFFADAGRRAAELWLQSAPLSMGAFRDNRYAAFASGLDLSVDAFARREAFNAGFAGQIGRSIAAQSRAGGRHG